jgi:Recombination endonuclease VII
VRRQGGHLQRRYGISREEYAALLARQGGVCAICGKPAEKTLCVDHCHSTGKIRGLLCRKCNFGLGCYAEDQAAMIATLAYLGHGASDGDGSGFAAARAVGARGAARGIDTSGRADGSTSGPWFRCRAARASSRHRQHDVGPAPDHARRDGPPDEPNPRSTQWR